MASVSVFDTPELLCLIFVALFSEDVDDDAELPIHSPLRAPVILTQVCRKWRQAALAYPILWSKLLLPFKTSMFVGNDGLVRPCIVLTEWLKRSYPLPFTLKVTCESDMDPEPCPCCYAKDPSLDMILIQSSRRWKALELELDCDQLTLFHESLPSLDLPELRTIFIGDATGLLSTPLRIWNAPKLENMTLVGGDVRIDTVVADRDLPPSLRFFKLWNLTFKSDANPLLPNIRSIHFMDVAIRRSDFARFPEYFPLLEDLEIFFHLIEDEHEELGDFVVLENLRSFRANCCYRFPVQSITTPKLRKLAIENQDWGLDGCTTFSDVHSLIKRSSPPLEVFHIGGLAIKGGAFAPFLDLVPHLKEIKIIDAPTTIHVLNALACPIQIDPSGTLGLRCPNLYSLECNLVLITDESPEELKSMEIEVLSILLTNRLKAGNLLFFDYPWTGDKRDLVRNRIRSRIDDMKK